MTTPPRPKISISLSLDPKSYTFDNPTPPILSLTLTCHAARPITLFTWNTPLDPSSGMSQAHFPITDLSTTPPTPIPQSSIRIQRAPISRARGSGDEPYYLTLDPNTSVTVSTRFARGGKDSGPRPQPRSVVERGWEIDEETGEERKTRRSVRGCGVDGLESGRRYRVDVEKQAIERCWWRYGTKEDVMVEEGSREWNLSELEPGEGELEVVEGEVAWVEFQVL
ncbi:MAG: hypothetical protein OHK93_007382 [Ramalina farinacea]|uniref:Uncharacterized protein n=1 Tax=Ramalina farinacea TaxID=258253 RepID=A0AA43QNR8_9LECA|nr:hypothetical protein [Ramalina farinacea]